MSAQRATSKTRRSAAVAATVGTTVEYYDFVVYGTAAGLVFPHVFFPDASATAGITFSLATFAVAYFARPLGAISFGHFGDRAGRKRILFISVGVTGGATFLIGCLPGFDTVGLAAPIVLVLLRFIQGFALGGEWGGAALIAIEHSPEGREGFFGTFVQLGSPIGSLLASLVFYVVSVGSTDLVLSQSWRVPFLFSGLLTVSALVLRVRLSESPKFSAAKNADALVPRPVVAVLSSHWRAVLLGAGALLLGFGGFQIVSIWLLLVFAPSVGVSEPIVLIAGVLLNFVSILTFSAYGKFGDRFGIAKVSIFGCVYTIVMAFPMFAMVASGVTPLVLLAAPVCYSGSGIVFALNSSLVAHLFPTAVRNTGISLASTVAALLGGALAPLISVQLHVLAGGRYWLVSCYFILLACISLASIIGVMRSDRRRTGSATVGHAIADRAA